MGCPVPEKNTARGGGEGRGGGQGGEGGVGVSGKGIKRWGIAGTRIGLLTASAGAEANCSGKQNLCPGGWPWKTMWTPKKKAPQCRTAKAGRHPLYNYECHTLQRCAHQSSIALLSLVLRQIIAAPSAGLPRKDEKAKHRLRHDMLQKRNLTCVGVLRAPCRAS